MARISGVNIPTNKRINIALTYIFGIGPKKASNICIKASIDQSKRVNQLNDDEVTKIREIIEELSFHPNKPEQYYRWYNHDTNTDIIYFLIELGLLCNARITSIRILSPLICTGFSLTTCFNSCSPFMSLFSYKCVKKAVVQQRCGCV